MGIKCSHIYCCYSVIKNINFLFVFHTLFNMCLCEYVCVCVCVRVCVCVLPDLVIVRHML